MIATIERLAHVALHILGYRSRRIRTSAGIVHALDGRGFGSLPPTVLLHGFSASGIHYATLMRQLRPHVKRLVVPDFPAHGQSQSPRHVSFEAVERGLFEALDELISDDEPAVLFGNSMGGHAAILYALSRPKKVAGLLLCSPGGAAMTSDEVAAFVRTFEIRDHAEALEFTDRLFARQTPLRRFIAWGVQKKFEKPDLRVLLASLRPEDLLTPEDLKSLKVPTLVLWGRADTILTSESREFYRRNLPQHARLEEPDGYGHSPYLDSPREVGQRLLSFLAEVAGQKQQRELNPVPAKPEPQQETHRT